MYSRPHWFIRLLGMILLGAVAYLFSEDLLVIYFMLLVPVAMINFTTDAGGEGVTWYLIGHGALTLMAWIMGGLSIFTPRGLFILVTAAGFLVAWDMVFSIIPERGKNGLVYDLGSLVILLLPLLCSGKVTNLITVEGIMSVAKYATLIGWAAYLLVLLFGGHFASGGSSSGGSSRSSGGGRRATARDVERAWDKCRARLGVAIRISHIDDSGYRMDVYLDVPSYTDQSSVRAMIQHLGGYLSGLDTDHIHFRY